MSESRDFRTFYRRELMEMVDRAAVEVIRGGLKEDDNCDEICPMACFLEGVFGLLDNLKARIDDPEVE